MSKIAISSFKKFNVKKRDFKSILNISFGFIIGYANIFNFINPFAIGYLCIFLNKDKKQFMLIAISILLGLLKSYNGIYTLAPIIGVLLLILVKNKYNSISKGLVGSLTVMLSSLIVLYKNMNLYFILAYFSLALVTFFLPIIMEKGVNVLSFEKNEPINTNEIISLSVIFMAILLGIDGFQISFIYLNLYIIITLSLMLCGTKNLTISTGTIIITTFLPLIKNEISATIIISLCVSALLSSISKNNTKLKILLCFSIGLLVSYFYIDKNIFNKTMLYTILLSYISFLLTPKHLHIRLQKTFGYIENNSIDHGEKIKFYTKEKIKKFNKAFENLSNTYKNINTENKTFSKEAIAKVIDSTVNDTCMECRKKKSCWNRNFYSTFKLVQNIIENINSGNHNGIKIEKKEFNKVCFNTESFILNLERNFKSYEKELFWQNKLINNKLLLSDQFKDISLIFKNIFEDLENNLVFYPDLENEIFKIMEKNNLAVNSIVVMENENKIINTWIKLKINMRETEGFKIVEKITSDTIGRKLSIVESSRYDNNFYEIYLEEVNSFKVITGIAKVNKGDAAISGDSYSTYKLGNKEIVLAVSDGMGSGKKANFDSHFAIELFEDFIETGFSKELALKFINSSLVLKGEEERFTTFDSVCIDLYNGIGHFMKVGASPSFIIRENKIEIIQSNSLPIGILNTVKSESTIKKLKKGDTIILITDGVLEVIKDTKEQIKWISDILWNNKNKGPIELSEIIINEALNMCANDETDDMTCVIGKII